MHSQNEGRRQLLLQGDQLHSHICWKNHLVVRGRSSGTAYGKCRNWSETWGLSRQNHHRLPEELPKTYKISNMQGKNVKHKTYLEINSNSRTGGIIRVRFTEKLKGAEKVAMQVLHVVTIYDCKENTHNKKKNTHNYIMYIRKYWVGRIHCLPTQCHDWVGGCQPCPLGSRTPGWIRLRCAANRDDAENRLHHYLVKTNVSALVHTAPPDDVTTIVFIGLGLRKFIELVSHVAIVTLYKKVGKPYNTADARHSLK